MGTSQRTDLDKSTRTVIGVGEWKKACETIRVSDEPFLVYLHIHSISNSLGSYGREHINVLTMLRRKVRPE